MKKILSATMFCGISNFMQHYGCFEILEAHFLIDQDYTPWFMSFKGITQYEWKTNIERVVLPEVVENVGFIILDFKILTFYAI